MTRSIPCFLAAVLLLAGCQHFSMPFFHTKPNYNTVPEAQLREVALEIERAVKAGNREPEIADRENIVVNTPGITQAIRTRAARMALLDDMLNRGQAFEKPNGHCYFVNSKEYRKSTKRRERDRHSLMLNGEAGNRWAIYEGLIEANKFPRRSLSAIEDAFFKARIAVMEPGQQYEGPDGEPVAKSGESADGG